MAENTPNSFLPLGNTTEELAGLHGKEKQLVVDTTKNTLVVMDGVTLGGHPLAKEGTKIKSGSEDVIINDSTEATLAGDVTIKNKPWGIVLDGEFPTDEEELAELANRVPVGGSVYGLAPLGPEDAIPAPYNSEEWVTESGTWTVPVSGWYEILAIDGGYGAKVSFSNWSVNGGYSGNYKKTLKYFEKGEVLSITIGAGGKGFMEGVTPGTTDITIGGETTISGVTFTNSVTRISGTYSYKATESNRAMGVGGGFGSIFSSASSSPTFYGAGGSAYLSGTSTTNSYVMDGKQGAVYFRYYDLNKDTTLLPSGA